MLDICVLLPFFFSIPEKRDPNRSTDEITNFNFRNPKINAEKKERKIIIITVREKDDGKSRGKGERLVVIRERKEREGI